MAGATSRLSLPLPVGSDAVEEYRVAINAISNTLDAATTFTSGTFSGLGSSLAGKLLHATDTKQWLADNGSSLDALLTLGNGYLTPAAAGTSTTAVAGTFIVAQPSVTITLPAATAGICVGVIAGTSATGANPVTITRAGSDAIQAVGVNSATSLTLGSASAYIILECSAAGTWRNIAGEQNTGWQSLSLTSTISVANITLGGGGGSYNVTPAVKLVGSRAILRGGMTTATSHVPASWATIPSGFRPASPVVWDTTALNTLQTYIQISTAGVITDSDAIYSSGSSTTVFLDGLTYEVS